MSVSWLFRSAIPTLQQCTHPIVCHQSIGNRRDGLNILDWWIGGRVNVTITVQTDHPHWDIYDGNIHPDMRTFFHVVDQFLYDFQSIEHLKDPKISKLYSSLFYFQCFHLPGLNIMIDLRQHNSVWSTSSRFILRLNSERTRSNICTTPAWVALFRWRV